jgi:hypothetical protein
MILGDEELTPDPSAENVYFKATHHLYRWSWRLVANISPKEDTYGFDSRFYDSTEV